MAYDNSNTGVLFHQEVESGSKKPSVSGKIVLSKELVKEMIDLIKAGKEPEIRVAGWDKVSKAGKPFISLVASGPAEAAKYSNKPEEKKAKADDFSFG